MPRDLRKALYSLQNKHNLNKMELLKAADVTIEELDSVDGDEGDGEDDDGDPAS